jgi:hypothetical protein
MKKMQFSTEKISAVRCFTVEILRGSRTNGGADAINSTATELFRKYADLVPLAIQYSQSLNGKCPKTKERINLAIREFSQMKILAENSLLSGPDGKKEIGAFDFLPLHPISRAPMVELLIQTRG